jgi:ribosome-associated protein
MDDELSKSEKKRQADALQEVGTQLVGLSLPLLQSLPLPDKLYQAIVEAKAMKSHGAIRRQAQFIGKLMRKADYEAILAAYAQLQEEASAKTAHFHEVEHWRDQLISEAPDALTAFIAAYPTTEIQQLRHLIKKAKEAQTKPDTGGAAKALFRYLKDLMQ